jgi:hypothetical protein
VAVGTGLGQLIVALGRSVVIVADNSICASDLWLFIARQSVKDSGASLKNP